MNLPQSKINLILEIARKRGFEAEIAGNALKLKKGGVERSIPLEAFDFRVSKQLVESTLDELAS